MIKNPKRYTITAALPYTNGPIHIGHLAGVYVPSDIYSRYLRLQGRDVAFICGSDEHGVAISMKAKKEGITPQQVIDKYDAIIRKSFVDFGISFDNYCVRLRRSTTIRLRRFFGSSMTMANSSRKSPNSCMMKRRDSF